MKDNTQVGGEVNLNTQVANVQHALELNLFEYSTPKSGTPGELIIAKRMDADGKKVIGMAMTPIKRGDLAKKMNLKTKDGAVTAALRTVTDALLTFGLNEIQSGMAQGKLTGARFAKSKTGRLTLSAVSPEKRTVTAEQLEATVLSMTPAEREQFMDNMAKAGYVPNVVDAKTGTVVKGKGAKAAKKEAKSAEKAKPAATPEAKPEATPESPTATPQEPQAPEVTSPEQEADEARAIDESKADLSAATVEVEAEVTQ